MIMINFEGTFGAAGTGLGFNMHFPVMAPHLCVVGRAGLANRHQATTMLTSVEVLERRREGF